MAHNIAEIKKDIVELDKLLKGKLDTHERLEIAHDRKVLENKLAEAEAGKFANGGSIKIKELQEDIDTLKELLAGDLADDERKDFQDELDALEVKLVEEEGKGAEKEVVKDEKKEPKPVKKEKAIKAPKPAKEKKAKASKGDPIIIVDGKEYDLNDCKQAISALKARKTQSRKLGKKYKSKKPASKAAGNVETLIHQVEGAISGKKVDDNPKLAIKTLKEFKSKMNEAFTILGKIMSQADVATIKKSLSEIDAIIAKYQD